MHDRGISFFIFVFGKRIESWIGHYKLGCHPKKSLKNANKHGFAIPDPQPAKPIFVHKRGLMPGSHQICTTRRPRSHADWLKRRIPFPRKWRHFGATVHRVRCLLTSSHQLHVPQLHVPLWCLSDFYSTSTSVPPRWSSALSPGL